MGKFPPTGLFDGEASSKDQARQLFRVRPMQMLVLHTINETYLKDFTRRMLDVLAVSPRQIKLDELTQEAVVLYDTDSQVPELFKFLDLNRGDAFLKIIHKKEQLLVPGPVFNQWQKQQDFIDKPNPFTSAEFFNELKQGLQQKSFERDHILLTDDQLEQRAQRIKAASEAKVQAKRDEAELFWRQKVILDPQYIRFKEKEQVWHTCGLQRLVAEFENVDKGAGNDRRSRGGLFEDQRSEMAFKLVQQSFEQGSFQLPPTFDLHSLLYVRSPRWTHPRQASMTLGEIDVLVYCMNGATRVVVAVIEMKSSAFEIGVGYRQQRSKLEDHQSFKILDGEGNEYVVPDEHIPPVFVTTLIPPNFFLIGAQLSVVFYASEALFDNCPHGDQRGRSFDLSDDDKVDTLMETIRHKGKLTISPQQFLREVWMDAHFGFLTFDPHVALQFGQQVFILSDSQV
jgi:hypothetical protein